MSKHNVDVRDVIEAQARELAGKVASLRASVVHLIEGGGDPARPSYVATGDGPDDLGRRAEEYLRGLVGDG
jgi:hypothetical protein